MSILIEILPLVFSLFLGAFTTYKKQEAEDLHKERMYALKATEAARSDQNRSASWSRKFIVQSVIGSLFLFPMFLTVLNFYGNAYIPDFAAVAIYIPEELKYGGLLSFIWSKETIEYVPVYGFVLMPIHVLMTQTIVGYYFGASAMKR
jgi:hypothetical protein